ncbi:MAG TPA: site-2 protease family protein [Solirubrobacter sp.]|nr:site-2 protease family protein [Solirubrobacter sp.]
MPTGSSIQLVRLFGIRIGVSASWFIVLFLFIFLLSDSFQEVLGGSDTQAYLVAVIAALLFFVSLILHELGHAVVARRNGIEVTGIDLWFFGGIAKLSRDSHSPGEEFRIAAAGPFVTLLIVGACVGIGAAIDGQSFVDAAVFDRGATSSPGLVMLAWLATINAGLFVFNLVPGFPLDGGRIARAIAWKLTGEKAKATRFAGRTGQLIAYAMAGLGVYLMLRGHVANGLWLGVLALFLAQAARSAVVQSDIDERLEGVTVGDVMDPHPFTVAADMSVLDASEQIFGPHGWPWVAVTEADGRYAGVLHQEAVEHTLASGQPALPAREVVREEGWRFQIGVDEPLEELLGTEGLRRLGAVFAVDRDGVLRGVVTIDQVRRALTPAR